MKIGIIGSGIVGRVLGNAFLQEGHEVMLGTRDTSKEDVVKFKEANPGAQIGSFADTAKFGEVVVLATGGSVTLNAIELAGKENFSGKVVIDTTNPISAEPPVNGVLKYFTDINYSLMERIQEAIPGAKLVKAFNSVGNAFMYKPKFESKPTMFICGNDDSAKQTVTGILTTFGWETEDVGKVESARAIEPLCILWCAPGFLRNQWTHAFKLLKL
jgi:8-hydroxy-5-deazaflavin:NADPH oxidoreductase